LRHWEENRLEKVVEMSEVFGLGGVIEFCASDHAARRSKHPPLGAGEVSPILTVGYCFLFTITISIRIDTLLIGVGSDSF
jgi:hypothetical protein